MHSVVLNTAGPIIPTFPMEKLKHKEPIDLLNLIIGGDKPGTQVVWAPSPSLSSLGHTPSILSMTAERAPSLRGSQWTEAQDCRVLGGGGIPPGAP